MKSPAEFSAHPFHVIAVGARPEFHSAERRPLTTLTTDSDHVLPEDMCGPRPHISEHPVYQDLLTKARRLLEAGPPEPDLWPITADTLPRATRALREQPAASP